MQTQTATLKTDQDREIQDENLCLISATSRLLAEADKVRRHRDRLLLLIRQSTACDEQTDEATQ